MTWLLPYLLAAEVGVWACVPGSRISSLANLSTFMAALGLLSAGYGAWAQRIDAKLGELDRLAIRDPRVQMRLTDRLAARRGRLVLKRIAIFGAGVVAMAAGGIFSRSENPDLRVVSVLVGMGAGFLGCTGCILLFVESTSLDERSSEIKRYVDKLKASGEDGENLRSGIGKESKMVRG